MNERNYLDQTNALFEQIKRGAFLTVKAGDAINTMTIGWATIGWIVAAAGPVWSQSAIPATPSPCSKRPTISPSRCRWDPDPPKALTLCGTKSGRDMDKFAESGLQPKPARTTESPVIDVPGVHYECRIVYKSAMDSAFLDPALDKLYPQKDFHTLYFGEILSCYETE